MDSSGSLIRLSGVGKRYGGEYILKDVDLEVGRGDYIVVMGRSGVGKTSLFRILSLLLPPDEGVMYLKGDLVDWGDEDGRASLRTKYYGTLFQGKVLISTLTAYENILLAFRVKGLEPDSDLIMRYMDLLEVRHLWDRYPDSFSAGEYQRVAIIRALITDPEILILDEPYANLSSEYIKTIDEILWEKNRMGTTIIMSTTMLDRTPINTKTYILQDTRLELYNK